MSENKQDVFLELLRSWRECQYGSVYEFSSTIEDDEAAVDEQVEAWGRRFLAADPEIREAIE